LIICLRLIEQIVREESLPDMIISAVLFADALVLCIYSLFFKRQEIT
jgi:hypothetical protein